MLFSNTLVLLLIAVISEIYCSDPRYSRSSSKTCTKLVPTSSLPVNSPHVHARHGMSTVESCCEGYTENYYDQSICDPVCDGGCVNGYCREPNQCECHPGYIKNLVGDCIPTCPNSCGNGACYNGQCFCNSGYTLEPNKQFCVPYCPSGCGQNANCTRPGHCECQTGFRLSAAQICESLCRRDCGKGKCNNYGLCDCERGYELRDSTCQPAQMTSNPSQERDRYRENYPTELSSRSQQQYPCPRECGPGRCTEYGRCECEPGYELRDDTCQPQHDPAQERRRERLYNIASNIVQQLQCPLPCGRGRCMEYGRCECDPGYELVDDTCQPVPDRHRSPYTDDRRQQTSPPHVPYPEPEPQCPRPCGPGRCTQYGRCECEPGYELVDDTCQPVAERYRRPDERAQQTSPPQVPYPQPEPQCPRPCGPGRCTQYGRCECEPGYELVDETCQPVVERYRRPDERAQQTSPPQVPYPQPEPQCPRPCGPGKCTQYGRCECEPGYELVDETCQPMDERYRRPDERAQQTSPPQIPYSQPDPRYTQQQSRPCRGSCGYGRCNYNGECECEPGYELRDDTCQVPQEQYRPSEPSMRIQEATPRAEIDQSCPRPCGNGVCMYGRCECNPGYDLIDETCQIAAPDRNYGQQGPACPRSCGYGRCNAYGECECEQGYQLMDGTCQLVDRIFRPRQAEELRPQPSRCPRACGHGTCTLSGYCECDNGYELRDETCQATKQNAYQATQQPPPCRKPCGRGRCNQYGQCECEPGYELIDETCQEVPIVYRTLQINDRSQDSCPRSCGRGRCNEYGQCECEPGYELRDDTCQDIRSDPRYREQQQSSCRRQCGYGRCNAYGECECDPGYELIDETCQYPQSNYPQAQGTVTQQSCPRSCGYGRCNQHGQCECEPGYELRDDTCQEIEVFYRPPQQREPTQTPETDPYTYRQPSRPSCPRDCGHGRCDEYGRCECDRGYELRDDTCHPYNRPIERLAAANNQPSCSTPCTHGRCSPYGYCECDPGFQLNVLTNQCECEPGYELRDDQCQIMRKEPEYRRQQQCPKSCGYGRCNEYGRCDCDPGYELRDETCQSVRRDPPRECRRPCGDGICNEYGLCDCDPGYELIDETCQRSQTSYRPPPVSGQLRAARPQYQQTCPESCGHGECNEYGVCECDSGFEINPQTNKCECRRGYVENLAGFCIPACPEGCGNGLCYGGRCFCDPGYKLEPNSEFCIPKCTSECGPNANCTIPGYECQCLPGFRLSPSRTCESLCPRDCGNGECSEYGLCECDPGYALIDDTCQEINTGILKRRVTDLVHVILSPRMSQHEPSCPRPCGNGRCTEYGQCECDPGYELREDTCQTASGYTIYRAQPQRTCPKPCGPGRCTEYGQCECDSGYELKEDTCQPSYDHSANRPQYQESCPRPCGNGICTIQGYCECEYGYELRDDTCQLAPIIGSYRPQPQRSCPRSCGHGTCNEYGQCDCEPGYELKDETCQEYVTYPAHPRQQHRVSCRRSCGHGVCNVNGQCDCEYGYELREDTCQEARHDQGHRHQESCPRHCGHGRCEYGRCVCESGFELRDDVCQMIPSYEPTRAHSHGHVHCENTCLNGYCSGANTCTCNPGYIIQSGSYHICVPHCPQGCRNGMCIAPDQCSCNYGFRKDQRTQLCVR